MSKPTKTPFFEGDRGLALKDLVEALWSQGFVVYLAGGCVRDWLLGRTFKDVDVVTDAPVERIQQIFTKTIPVGVQFGIVRVLMGGVEFEVAQFRSDGPYRDGRRPEYVELAGPREDAARRDFTVNALFYDLKKDEVLDFVGGLSDLKQQVLRTVGDPVQRFSEDYLRILRLLRFSCQLDFEIEPLTAQAAEQLAPQLIHVSGERLCVEVHKAISSNGEKAVRGLRQWRMGEILFPQWRVDLSPLVSLRQDARIGWSMALWLLNFQYGECEKSLVGESPISWHYSKKYLEKIRDLAERFKLSKIETHRARDLASVVAWPTLWPQLRQGYRAALAQSDFFVDVHEAGKQLNLWSEAQNSEISIWRQNTRRQAFLTGEDVFFVPVEQRGLVLKESLYLQYEGVLVDRTQALSWLKQQF